MGACREDYAGRFDTTSQKHTVHRKAMASLVVSNLSILPIGFDQLPATNLAALLEFLATGSAEPAKQ